MAELRITHAKKPLAAEPEHHRRESERRVDAVDVHVAHALVDVPRAATHLVEADGRATEWSVECATRRRVATDIGLEPAVDQPELSTVLLHDTRTSLAEAFGQPLGEHVTWLDQMVVDRDDPVELLARLGIGEQELRLGPASARTPGGIASHLLQCRRHGYSKGQSLGSGARAARFQRIAKRALDWQVSS